MVPADINERLIASTGYRVSEESDDEGTYFVLIEQGTNDQWPDDFETWNEAMTYAVTRLPYLLTQQGYVFDNGAWTEA